VNISYHFCIYVVIVAFTGLPISSIWSGITRENRCLSPVNSILSVATGSSYGLSKGSIHLYPIT